MSKTREYKAVANFFKNTTGILSKQELQDMVREVIRDEIHAWLTNRTQQIMNMITERSTSWRDGSAFRQELAEAIAKRYEIDIKMKPKTQVVHQN